MSDLISKSALLKDKVFLCGGFVGDEYAKGYMEALDKVEEAINNAPTVEAKPVVHGEWKSDLDSCGWINHTCSHCGYEKLTDIHVSLGWNYCPKVGEWIPVEERLPEKPDYGITGYIVQQGDVIEPYSAYWDGESWTDFMGDGCGEITAWMPLPEPYRKKVE